MINLPVLFFFPYTLIDHLTGSSGSVSPCGCSGPRGPHGSGGSDGPGESCGSSGPGGSGGSSGHRSFIQ